MFEVEVRKDSQMCNAIEGTVEYTMQLSISSNHHVFISYVTFIGNITSSQFPGVLVFSLGKQKCHSGGPCALPYLQTLRNASFYSILRPCAQSTLRPRALPHPQVTCPEALWPGSHSDPVPCLILRSRVLRPCGQSTLRPRVLPHPQVTCPEAL